MSVKKTMVCDAAKAFLSRYQDNELDPAIRAQIDTHLQACETCQKELLQLKEITTRVKRLPEVKAGPYFNAQVMGKVIEKEKEKKSRWLAWFPLPSSSLSLAKVIYTVVFIIFLLLGVLANMNTGSPVSNFPAGGDIGQDQQQELQMVRVLVESQDLSLINVQDKTIAMLYNGNGGTYAK
jgi:anti-sigma factor RsiW